MHVASLSPAVTEILFALEQQKKIVCTDQLSDYPDAARDLPKLKNIDAEELKTFIPDIVFTSTQPHVELTEELKKSGYAVIHQNPRSIGDLYESIRAIGMLLDCMPRAHALVESLQQGFNDTKRKSGLLPRRPKVYVEEGSSPPTVGGSWIPELIKLAGGTPLPLPAGTASKEVSLAEIQSFDPDLIVLCARGGNAADKELIMKRAGWNELRAVRENHLFIIDDALLSRPGPRLPEAAKRLFGWIFQVMH